ncbi:MAG: hypothetical protein WBJ03_04075 [Moraxellaceae bacterium]
MAVNDPVKYKSAISDAVLMSRAGWSSVTSSDGVAVAFNSSRVSAHIKMGQQSALNRQ